jgi:hypothetical protein
MKMPSEVEAQSSLCILLGAHVEVLESQCDDLSRQLVERCRELDRQRRKLAQEQLTLVAFEIAEQRKPLRAAFHGLAVRAQEPTSANEVAQA